MEFINDNLWIIFVTLLALVAYTKVWNLTVRRQTLWNHLTLFLSDTFLPVTYPV